MPCLNLESGVWYPQGDPAHHNSVTTIDSDNDFVNQITHPMIAFVLVWGMVIPVAYSPVATTVTRAVPDDRGVALTNWRFAALQARVGGSIAALQCFLEIADTVAPDHVNGYLMLSSWSERRRRNEARLLVDYVTYAHGLGREIVDNFVY